MSGDEKTFAEWNKFATVTLQDGVTSQTERSSVGQVLRLAAPEKSGLDPRTGPSTGNDHRPHHRGRRDGIGSRVVVPVADLPTYLVAPTEPTDHHDRNG